MCLGHGPSQSMAESISGLSSSPVPSSSTHTKTVTRIDPQVSPTVQIPAQYKSEISDTSRNESWLGPVQSYRTKLRTTVTPSPTVPAQIENKSEIPDAPACTGCYRLAAIRCEICCRASCNRHSICGHTSSRCTSCLSSPGQQPQTEGQQQPQDLLLARNLEQDESKFQKKPHTERVSTLTSTPPVKSTWSPGVFRLAELLDAAATPSPAQSP